MQDSFLDAWNQIEKYDPQRGSFKTWLLILCKYRALNIRRLHKNPPEVTEYEELSAAVNESPESGMFHFILPDNRPEMKDFTINILNKYSIPVKLTKAKDFTD